MAMQPDEPPDDRPAIYKLAYDEGIRVLEDQGHALEQLRVRIAVVLGTTTTASAFLVGVIAQAKSSEQDSWYWVSVIIGVLLYAAVVLSADRSLRPKYVWRFNTSPRTIVEGYADHEQPASLSETYRELALVADKNIVHNRALLDRIQGWLSRALTLMIADIAVWACLVARVG